MTSLPWIFPIILLLCCFLALRTASAYTVNPDPPFGPENSFSLSAYQKARATETSRNLDASRFHFQILFVDNNNFHGRIAEGVMSRVAEYNDALFTLFPASATIVGSKTAPLDAAAPAAALAVCESLDLCPTRSAALGSSFDMSNLDEYDLIVAMDDEIQSLILRSLPPDDQNFYAPKCRLLSEFWNVDFCNIHANTKSTNTNKQQQEVVTDQTILLDMLDPDLRERAAPYADWVQDSSSDLLGSLPTVGNRDNVVNEPRMIVSKDTGAAIPNLQGWPLMEAAILLASAGLTRFCIDTMDSQFETAFQSLLKQHFCRSEHLGYTFDQADEQLRKGSFSVTGYFSPEQRQKRFEDHLSNLQVELQEGSSNE